MATATKQSAANLPQGKVLDNKPETTLNLSFASEMTKSNGRQIDQGVSGYWLYHVETCITTDRKEEQQLVLHVKWQNKHIQTAKETVGTVRIGEKAWSSPRSGSLYTSQPCPAAAAGQKKLRLCSGIRHILSGQTNHPTGPWPYDFSQHFISKGAIVQKSTCITKELQNTMY